jgi:hypothetical protein
LLPNHIKGGYCNNVFFTLCVTKIMVNLFKSSVLISDISAHSQTVWRNIFLYKLWFSSLSSVSYAVNLQNDFHYLSMLIYVFLTEYSCLRWCTFFITHFAFSCGWRQIHGKESLMVSSSSPSTESIPSSHFDFSFHPDFRG